MIEKIKWKNAIEKMVTFYYLKRFCMYPKLP